jgi:hypothetical protein
MEKLGCLSLSEKPDRRAAGLFRSSISILTNRQKWSARFLWVSALWNVWLMGTICHWGLTLADPQDRESWAGMHGLGAAPALLTSCFSAGSVAWNRSPFSPQRTQRTQKECDGKTSFAKEGKEDLRLSLQGCQQSQQPSNCENRGKWGESGEGDGDRCMAWILHFAALRSE